ncbi:ribonuclease III domain-containing protein [Lachnospiraceae bacterium 62-35]
MEESLTVRLKELLKLKEMDADSYSPLALAYIGDAAYELLIRTKVMNHGNVQVNKMHKRTADLVKAGTQARLYKLIEEELAEEERAVYRRGRNAKSGTMARHATVADYRTATGFEALMGWLYLRGDIERMAELTAAGLSKAGMLRDGMSSVEGREKPENHMQGR